jgi:hypothetical protein
MAATLVLSLASAGPAFPQSPDSSMGDSFESRNKALIQEKFDAWLEGTGSPLDLLAEDAS